MATLLATHQPSSSSSTASLLSLPPARHHSQRQGILLSQPLPQYTPASPSSWATARPMTMGGSRSPCSRRIRFAPLPDPRRSVLITDDGNELPFPQPNFATQFPAPPTPSPTIDPRRDYFSIFETSSLSSSSSDSKRNSYTIDPSSSSSASSTPGTATPVSITTTTPSEYDNNGSVPPSPTYCPSSPLVAVSNKLSAVSASSSKSRSFFSFRLKRSSASSSPSSSNTLTPVASNDRSQHTPTASSTSFSRRNFSAEEILTLGTINLFRPSSSRDTSDNEGLSSGWSLARWSSAGSHHSHKEPSWGSPLARVSSTQSYQSKSKSKSNNNSNNASKNVRSTGIGPGRKGTRLLNGRVYGVKRPQNANPFANVRDEEPEFVEWGYGGMGSVKGATSAGVNGRWERLHGQSNAAASAVAGAADEEDDGSGMLWLKKRREQREREQKEKDDKETKEAEAVTEEKKEEEEEKKETTVTEPTTTLAPPPVERPTLEKLPSRPGTAGSAKTVSTASSLTVTPCLPTPQAPAAASASASASVTAPSVASPSPAAAATPAAASTSTTTTATPTISITAEEEHVTRAVNIPAPLRYQPHHRGHQRGGSKDVSAEGKSAPLSVIDDTSKESESESRSNSESESESDVEREEEDEDEEEDSEEDEEEQEQRRKTALGAGVEKISRHH